MGLLAPVRAGNGSRYRTGTKGYCLGAHGGERGRSHGQAEELEAVEKQQSTCREFWIDEADTLAQSASSVEHWWGQQPTG